MGENTLLENGIGIKRDWDRTDNVAQIELVGGDVVIRINGVDVHRESATLFFEAYAGHPVQWPTQGVDTPDTFIRALGGGSHGSPNADTHDDVYEYSDGLFTWVGSDAEAEFRDEWMCTEVTEGGESGAEYNHLSERFQNQA
jgi:hypothetical protein